MIYVSTHVSLWEMQGITAADWGKKRYHSDDNWAWDGTKPESDFRPGRSIPILGRNLSSNALAQRRRNP